jgi:hypothetical protein
MTHPAVEAAQHRRRGITTQHRRCKCQRLHCHGTAGRRCGKPLPVPRGTSVKICAECREKKRRDVDAAWRRSQRRAKDLTLGRTRKCAFQGEGCLLTFKRKHPREKNCDVCKEPARKARQAAHNAARYRADPKTFNRKQREARETLRKQAVFGKIFEELKNKRVSQRLIVMLKLLDPTLTKADLRKFGGKEADLSDRQMTRIFDQINAWLREFSRVRRVKTPGPTKPVN